MYGVTVYPVIGLPPVAGALQLTVAWVSPAVADGADGAEGATGGGAGAAVLKTSVAAGHGVFGAVPGGGVGVAPPPPRIWPRASNSLSGAGATLGPGGCGGSATE